MLVAYSTRADPYPARSTFLESGVVHRRVVSSTEVMSRSVILITPLIYCCLRVAQPQPAVRDPNGRDQHRGARRRHRLRSGDDIVADRLLSFAPADDLDRQVVQVEGLRDSQPVMSAVDQQFTVAGDMTPDLVFLRNTVCTMSPPILLAKIPVVSVPSG